MPRPSRLSFTIAPQPHAAWLHYVGTRPASFATAPNNARQGTSHPGSHEATTRPSGQPASAAKKSGRPIGEPQGGRSQAGDGTRRGRIKTERTGPSSAYPPAATLRDLRPRGHRHPPAPGGSDPLIARCILSAPAETPCLSPGHRTSCGGYGKTGQSEGEFVDGGRQLPAPHPVSAAIHPGALGTASRERIPVHVCMYSPFTRAAPLVIGRRAPRHEPGDEPTGHAQGFPETSSFAFQYRLSSQLHPNLWVMGCTPTYPTALQYKQGIPGLVRPEN